MAVDGSDRKQGAHKAGLWLSAAAAGCYGVAYAWRPDVAAVAVERFADLALRIAPAFAVVYVLMLLAELVLDRRRIARHLGRASGARGWAMTLAAGVLSVGPMYAWFPLLADLRARGMSPALIGGFLYSRAVKLPLLPLLIQYFGPAYATLLTVSILLGAVANGWIAVRLAGDGPTR